MMTPQQAERLFMYADWAMLLAGLATVAVLIILCVCATLPSNKGRRSRTLRWALMFFLIFALFYGTQWSLTHQHAYDLSPLLYKVIIALPLVVILSGLIASIGYTAHAILRRSGTDRRQAMLKSLLGVPHASRGATGNER